MGALLRTLFLAIGYLSTATVITAALALGYLWYSERIDNEKIFRITALMHDIDLEQIAAAQAGDGDAAPPEEMSPDELAEGTHVLERNFEIKLLALQRGRQEFDKSLQLLKERMERHDRLAKEWQERFQQQGELTTQESVARVVQRLQIMPAEGAKEMLMKMMEDNRKEDVIRLLNSMSISPLKKILKAFQNEEEKKRLYEVLQLTLDGYPEKAALDQAIRDLQALDATQP